MTQPAEDTINELVKARRWVFKFGSALVTDGGAGLNLDRIAEWCNVISKKQKQDYENVIISSGSIAEGMVRLKLRRRPESLQQLQAVAAVGQLGVSRVYEDALRSEGLHAAMVLLTRQDLLNRHSYLNARNALDTLIKMQVIPVINENDTVATEEICFGDNDFLAALIANLIEADVLVLATDQKGLCKQDPSHFPEAELIKQAEAKDPILDQYAGPSGKLGRGGMKTKLLAARQAALSGTWTVICDGHDPAALEQLMLGRCAGTLLSPGTTKMTARKRWLLSQSDNQNGLILDDGAVRMLCHVGKSLLPVGVVLVKGNFDEGALVSCQNKEGVEIAKGLVNYSSAEAKLIQGCKSHELLSRLGYVGQPELIHRNNLVLV